MADLPPPGKPTKGKADDTSGPSGDQHNAEIQQDISIRQILAQQKAGKFDLDRDFGTIKNPAEFKRRNSEYEAMNDKPKRCTDFPPDSKTQMQWVLTVGKAICNTERATDATNKKIASARQDEEDQDGRDRAGDEADGSIARSEDRPSSAVTHLNRLKPAEVELMSWKAVLFAKAAQKGKVSRGAFGNTDRLQREEYDSWRDRMVAIIDGLEVSQFHKPIEEITMLNWSDPPQTSKCVARALFQKGDDYIRALTASPKATLKKHAQYKKNNDGRSDKIAEMKEARRLAASKQKDPSGLSSPAQPLAEAIGDILTEKKAQAPGAFLTRGGRQRNHESSSNTPSAEKQKQSSAVPRTSPTGQRQTQSTVPTGGETWLDTVEEGTKSLGSPASSPSKRSSKDGHSIPDDTDFSDVARPDVHDHDGPVTSTITQSNPYRFVGWEQAPSTAASPPTSHNTRNEPKSAFSSSIDPQVITANIARYRTWKLPHLRVPNKSTAEAMNKDFSPPVLPTQPSSENDQDPENPYYFHIPAEDFPEWKGLPSSTATQPLQGSSGPSSVGEGSSQHDIPATLDARSPAKKRRLLSSQSLEEPDPDAHGATADGCHKRHKRDSSGSSMDVNVDDTELDDTEWEDDTGREDDDYEDDDDEYYEEEQ